MAKIIKARNISTCKPTPTATRVGGVNFTRANKGTELFVPREIALIIAQELHRGIQKTIDNESLQSLLHKDFEQKKFPWKVSIA